MKKFTLLLGMFAALQINNAHGASVSDRKTCAEIQSQIDALGAMDAPDASQTAELANLRETYRRDCVKRSTGRSRGGAVRTPVADTVDEDDDKVVVNNDTETQTAAPCDVPDEHGCCPGEVYTDMGPQGFNCCPSDGGMCFAPMAVEPTAPDKSEEEIAAEIEKNIAAGLCADGSKPNKFGCCAGETFKDLGNTVFACCRDGGDECFPPIK